MSPLSLQAGLALPSPSLLAMGEWHLWRTPGDLYLGVGVGGVVWTDENRVFPGPVGSLGMGYRYVTEHRWCWGFEAVTRVAGHDATDHRIAFTLGSTWGVAHREPGEGVHPGVGVPVVLLGVPLAFVLTATALSGGTLF